MAGSPWCTVRDALLASLDRDLNLEGMGGETLKSMLSGGNGSLYGCVEKASTFGHQKNRSVTKLNRPSELEDSYQMI